MSEQVKQEEHVPVEAEMLVVEVGNEEFEPGLTRLRLQPDGQVQIESRLSGKARRFEYKLSPDDAARLIKQSGAPELPLKGLGLKPGLPDEPLYQLGLYRGKELVQTLKVWRSELPEVSALYEDGEALL